MRPSKGTSKYNLVISQYEKHNTIFYTLKVSRIPNFNSTADELVFDSRSAKDRSTHSKRHLDNGYNFI